MLDPSGTYWVEVGVGALIVIDVLILTITEGELMPEDASLLLIPSRSNLIFALFSNELSEEEFA